MNTLEQLIYISTATVEMPDEELDRILAASVERNARRNVTGMLLYSRGTFMQVLEGAPAELDETYARIGRDPRHHSLLLVSRESIGQREFSRWTMGFRRLRPDDAALSPAYAAYTPFFTHGFTAGQPTLAGGTALELLKLFG